MSEEAVEPKVDAQPTAEANEPQKDEKAEEKPDTNNNNAEKDDTESKDSEKKEENNDGLWDVELEDKKLKQFIDLALNAAKGKEWTVYNTKDDRISVKYTKLPGENMYTIRGQMDIEMSIDTFHEFTHGDYEDIFKWEQSNDEMAKDIHCVKKINDDHTVVYGQFNAGFGLWPRDFCWMKRRFKFEKYEGEDGKTYRVGGDMCYSLDETHPHFVAKAKGHVRGWLALSGNVFVEKDDKICLANYIVDLNPNGWIPSWIVNLVAPEQGLVIKHVNDNWYKIVDVVKKRNENKNEDKTESTKENVKGRAKGTFLE